MKTSLTFQLKYVNILFQLAGKDIISAVKGEMSGDLEDGFKALGI
jgi:hypothetical protein